MQNRFKKALQACEIEDANFHTLRHTFATRCVELGFDLKSLSEILGHANVNITLNRYVHPSMELKQQNMNLLSDLLTVKGAVKIILKDLKSGIIRSFFAEYNTLRNLTVLFVHLWHLRFKKLSVYFPMAFSFSQKMFCPDYYTTSL